MSTALFTNFINVFRSELIVQLLPIPAGVILSRLLGPNDRGQLAEILLIPSLIATVITCNWDKFLKGELLNTDKNNFQIIFDQTLYLFIWQIIFVTSVAFLLNFIGMWAPFLTQSTALIFSLTIVTIQLGSNYLVAISSCALESNIIYKYKLYGVATYLFVVSLYLLKGEIGIYEAFAANQIVPLISIFLIFSLRKLVPLELIFKLKFDLNLLLGKFKNLHYMLLETLSNSIDLLIMIKFASAGEVGAYLSFKILEFPFKLFNLSCVSLITPIFRDFNSRLIRFSNLIGVLFLTAFGLSMLCLPILNEVIVYILGLNFIVYLWMSKFIITIGAIQNFFLLLLNFVVLKNNVDGYNRVVVYISILRSLLSVILFFFFGVVGIFYSLIISPILGIFLIYYFNLL